MKEKNTSGRPSPPNEEEDTLAESTTAILQKARPRREK